MIFEYEYQNTRNGVARSPCAARLLQIKQTVRTEVEIQTVQLPAHVW